MVLRTLLLLSFLLVHKPSAAQADARPGFVAVRGSELVLDGAPFRFLGANVSVIHGPRERAGYEAVLDAAVADGLRVIRVWALGEQPSPGAAHHPLYAFRIGEAGWVDESFGQLDHVLAAASARGLKVIVVLANRWHDYGGIYTYLQWAGSVAQGSPSTEPMPDEQTAFFECGRCQSSYREHVLRVVARRNAVSGVAYRDDPAIMAWELINEVSAVSAHAQEALLDWVASSAAMIRTLDPDHLIAAGHIGYQTARERRVWESVQRVANIDYADAHLYPQTDARVDPHLRPQRTLAWLVEDLVRRAHETLHKPLVIGEFGFERTAQGASRPRWMAAFTRVARERHVDGALVWQYEPHDAPIRLHTIRPDRSDADSLVVRQGLSRAAEELASGHADAHVETPLSVPPSRVVHGTGRVHTRARQEAGARVLDIAPEAFSRAQFERFGVYAGAPLITVWGQGEGEIAYRFAAEAGVPRSLQIEARISSELPGAGDGKDPRDGSDIEVSVDGAIIGTVRAKSDDGLGEVVRVALVDPFLLRRLFTARTVHRLRFRALPSAYAGGLCLYGAATGKLALNAGQIRPLTTVRVTLGSE